MVKPMFLCEVGAVLKVDKPGHILHGKKVTALNGGKTLSYLGNDFGEVIDIKDSMGAEFSLPVSWLRSTE